MKMLATLGLGTGAILAACAPALAGSIDLTPVINETIVDLIVPTLHAVAPAVAAVVVGVLTMPVKRFFDEKTATELTVRVNDGLDKAIAIGAQQAEKSVGAADFHVNVDGMVANVAADYALRHFPATLKKVGAAVSARAGDAAKQAAAQLLQEKIAARLSAHPAVAALKALAPPAPVAAAA